jgi:hypothetical protein
MHETIISNSLSAALPCCLGALRKWHKRWSSATMRISTSENFVCASVRGAPDHLTLAAARSSLHLFFFVLMTIGPHAPVKRQRAQDRVSNRE